MEDEVRIERISNGLKSGKLKCFELLLTLFCTVCLDETKISFAEPIPKVLQLKNSHEIDIDKARKLIAEIPSLKSIVEHPKVNLSKLRPETLELLDWVLFPEHFELEEVSLKDFTFSSTYKPNKKGISPSHVFRLIYKEDFGFSNQPFPKLYGYHGSGLANFHSILRKGLDLKYQKDKLLYGGGIYLSSGNYVAESFLTFGTTEWKNSPFYGIRFGCIVGCQVLDDPKEVRLIKHQENNAEDYLVVNKNSHVKIDSLLLYKAPHLHTKSEKSLGWIYVIVFWVFLLLWIAKS